jgi:isopentenyl phosphate kinase
LALAERQDLSLVVGHGSGSFGHTVAKRYGTQEGISDRNGWIGFARVATVAARLNQIVLDNFDAAGIPVFRIQPSASTICVDGQLMEMETGPLQTALREGLVPLIHGDVSIDQKRGGTIVSTEALFAYLAPILRPNRILLAGDYDGVYDDGGKLITTITPGNLSKFESMLGSSVWTDVTGGMASKVKTMLALCQQVPGLTVRIFSGQARGQISEALADDHANLGTVLTA